MGLPASVDYEELTKSAERWQALGPYKNCWDSDSTYPGSYAMTKVICVIVVGVVPY